MSFIFDSNQLIDVDALEQFVTNQKEVLLEDQNEFAIDISDMMVNNVKIAGIKPGANNLQVPSQSAQGASPNSAGPSPQAPAEEGV